MIGLIPGISVRDHHGDVALYRPRGARARRAAPFDRPNAGHCRAGCIVGAVPLPGDVFDVMWRANRRNIALCGTICGHAAAAMNALLVKCALEPHRLGKQERSAAEARLASCAPTLAKCCRPIRILTCDRLSSGCDALASPPPALSAVRGSVAPCGGLPWLLAKLTDALVPAMQARNLAAGEEIAGPR